MTFDAKSLLTEPLPPDLTVDGLLAILNQVQAVGMGGAVIALSDGTAIRKVDLVAHGERAAHFVLSGGPVRGELQR